MNIINSIFHNIKQSENYDALYDMLSDSKGDLAKSYTIFIVSYISIYFGNLKQLELSKLTSIKENSLASEIDNTNLGTSMKMLPNVLSKLINVLEKRLLKEPTINQTILLFYFYLLNLFNYSTWLSNVSSKEFNINKYVVTPLTKALFETFLSDIKIDNNKKIIQNLFNVFKGGTFSKISFAFNTVTKNLGESKTSGVYKASDLKKTIYNATIEELNEIHKIVLPKK